MKRRTLFEGTGGGGINPSEAVAMDVAFYTGSEIVIRKQEDWKDEETPIGIVVVPGTHDRYGDSSCGIMSLVEMDYNHPETGVPVSGPNQQDNINMYWWKRQNLINNNNFRGRAALTSDSNSIPYQVNNSSTACSSNESIIWPYAGSTTDPSSEPSTTYDNSGSYVTATSGKAGCDFNGVRNTAAIYMRTKSSNQWTANTVQNSITAYYSPVGTCAGRFKTVGTNSFYELYNSITSNNLNYGTSSSTMPNKGVWYLPALGELCYIPSKRYEINKTITSLNTKYGNVGTLLNMTYGYYWASCECDSNYVYFINTNEGYVSYISKENDNHTRAFMRL